jgi:transposase-like protein
MSADSNDEKKKRRFLSPEKKYQIFLEAQRSDVPVAEILRREGLYATDLVRIPV